MKNLLPVIISIVLIFLVFYCKSIPPKADSRQLNPLIERISVAPVNGGFSQEDYWVWGGCPIFGEDGRYHLFVSRWKKDMPFFIGYIFQSEIVRAVSDTPEGPYTFQEVVLPPRGPEYWDGMMTHNPTIRKVGDTYALFYIGATYDFPKPEIPVTLHDTLVEEEHKMLRRKAYSTIKIGLATSKSVYGPWRRQNSPVLNSRPGYWDDNVITNPAPFIGKNGEIFLIYRSNTPEGLRLGLARADSLGAPFQRIIDEPLFKFDKERFCEDPFVWWNGQQYEVIMKDMTGKITGEWHAGVHGYSKDGINWEIAELPKAYSRTVFWSNGDTTVQGSFERPQLLFDAEGRPSHIFAATADGPGGFRNATKTWCMVIQLE